MPHANEDAAGEKSSATIAPHRYACSSFASMASVRQMCMFNLSNHPHRRYNPLSREWVLVSPHRTQRPWQGQVEQTAPEQRPAYDPTCYLCPGNQRAGGMRNPAYDGTFVF